MSSKHPELLRTAVHFYYLQCFLYQLITADSADGKTLATAGMDGSLMLWDAANGSQNGKIQAHKSRITWMAFGPDGKTLATASSDRTARLFDLKTLKELRVLTVTTNR